MLRSPSRFFCVGTAIVVSLLAVLPRTTRAQLPIPTIGLVGGVSHYGFSSSSGSTPFGAVRVSIPLFVAVAEGSLGVLRPDIGGSRQTYIIPEAQLQWQLLPLLVKPYIGVGAGWFKSVGGSGAARNDLTLSASAGVRVGIPLTGIGFQAEARVRGIGTSFDDHATELTLGVHW